MSDNNTKKYAVVPADILKDLQKSQSLQETSTVGEKLISLDNEMENILTLNGISEMEKASKYADILTKFLEFKRQYAYSEQKKSTPIGATDIPVEDEEVNSVNNEDTLTTTPSIQEGNNTVLVNGKDTQNSAKSSRKNKKEMNSKLYSKKYKVELPQGWIDL